LLCNACAAEYSSTRRSDWFGRRGGRSQSRETSARDPSTGCLGWLGLPGGNGVFVVKSRGELRELVGVDVHGQGVVLRLESRVLSGLIERDAEAFAGCRPVGGAFERDNTVEDASLGVADLVGVGLSDGEIGCAGGRIGCGVGVQELFLVDAIGLSMFVLPSL
jgi:hypothetical protein